MIRQPMMMPINRSIGLCAHCRHVERITSARGSTFYLCRLSATDPRFPKYPVLPVLACEGYEPVLPQAEQAGSEAN